MLPVYIDVSNMLSASFTGVAVYVDNLIRNLRQEKTIELIGFYRLSRIRSLHKIRSNTHLPLKNSFEFLLRSDAVLFHGPDFWVPASSGKLKTVVTIHDLSILNPNFWPKTRREKALLRLKHVLLRNKPDAIICVSDFVRHEVNTFFPECAHKTFTVYHGADHLVPAASADDAQPVEKKPYILYLGTIEHRKNIDTLCKAYLSSSIRHKVRLILAGSHHGYGGAELIQHYASYFNNGTIEYLGYVSNMKRTELLRHALFSVYPSLYEGFGFPILEAMHMGVPVLTSDFGAMKEIAGTAALLCDTTRIDALQHALETLSNDATLRAKKIAAGAERVQAFTWKKCTTDTMAIYQNILPYAT